MPKPRPPSGLSTSLYDRPGFMIRRAHQIAVSVFMEETAEHGVTPTQFGILDLLHQRPGVDQITLARLLGLDRSTTGMVVKSLETAGFVIRITDSNDKRRRTLELTAEGQGLLERLRTPAASAVETLLHPLSERERKVFLKLLGKLTAALNATSRVPLLADADPKDDHADPPPSSMSVR